MVLLELKPRLVGSEKLLEKKCQVSCPLGLGDDQVVLTGGFSHTVTQLFRKSTPRDGTESSCATGWLRTASLVSSGSAWC